MQWQRDRPIPVIDFSHRRKLLRGSPSSETSRGSSHQLQRLRQPYRIVCSALPQRKACPCGLREQRFHPSLLVLSSVSGILHSPPFLPGFCALSPRLPLSNYHRLALIEPPRRRRNRIRLLGTQSFFMGNAEHRQNLRFSRACPPCPTSRGAANKCRHQPAPGTCGHPRPSVDSTAAASGAMPAGEPTPPSLVSVVQGVPAACLPEQDATA